VSADQPDPASADGNALYRRIIRAAEELFKKSGFRGVTMEGVARDAAVSKVTLYSHFRNKEDLFLAVCSRMAHITGRAFGDALCAPQQTVDDRIAAAILAKHRLTFTLVRTSPHAEDLFSHKARLAGDVFAQADEAMLTQLAKTLEADDALRPSAEQLARALFFGSGELAARSQRITELESDLRAFVLVHLAGARALARRSPSLERSTPSDDAAEQGNSARFLHALQRR
jgi:AcrR family transcriptional regulator